MAIVKGTITETGQEVQVDLPTARHPELPKLEEIDGKDIFTVWDESENKTKAIEYNQLLSAIGGGGESVTPVLSGADLEVLIPPILVGQKRYDLPAIAGKRFSLERIGQSGSTRYLSSWFNVLPSGGFELAREWDEFYEDDAFILHLYDYVSGGESIPGGGGSGGYKGILSVFANKTLYNDDMYKLISVQGEADKLVLTLDSVENITENSELTIATMVNVSSQTTIQTTGGQFIYINGNGYSKVYLGIGESLRLMRGDDGWYTMTEVKGYTDLGQPIYCYGTPSNTLPANGSLVLRADYPRLWEQVQSFGASLLSDTDWSSGTSNDRRGCFSTGNGSTNFRLPDLRGTVPRALYAGRTGMTLLPQTYNMPGAYQQDNVGPANGQTENMSRRGNPDGNLDRVPNHDNYFINSGKDTTFRPLTVTIGNTYENVVKSTFFNVRIKC